MYVRLTPGPVEVEAFLFGYDNAVYRAVAERTALPSAPPCQCQEAVCPPKKGTLTLTTE